MVEASGAGQCACDEGWSTGITADSSSWMSSSPSTLPVSPVTSHDLGLEFGVRLIQQVAFASGTMADCGAFDSGAVSLVTG